MMFTLYVPDRADLHTIVIGHLLEAVHRHLGLDVVDVSQEWDTPGARNRDLFD